jgi:hypothetical protein
MLNLIHGGMLLLAPDGAGGGSADGGNRQPGSADLLSNAFAGADGGKPAEKPAASGDAAAGGTDAGSASKLAPWAEQLPAELRDNPELAARIAKFQKVGDMAKAYLELEGKAAGAAFPEKDATPEAVAEFWEKAGRPKAADGYSFAKDKEGSGEAFAQAAFGANLTEAQAAAMLRNLQEIGAKNAQAYNDANARRRTETAAALEKEYGTRYAEHMELLSRGLAAAGPNVAKLLARAGLDGEPEIVKAFIAYGKMAAESGASRGGDAGASLKSVFEGGSFDYKD